MFADSINFAQLPKEKRKERKMCPFPAGFLSGIHQSISHPAANPARMVLLSKL